MSDENLSKIQVEWILFAMPHLFPFIVREAEQWLVSEMWFVVGQQGVGSIFDERKEGMGFGRIVKYFGVLLSLWEGWHLIIKILEEHLWCLQVSPAQFLLLLQHMMEDFLGVIQ